MLRNLSNFRNDIWRIQSTGRNFKLQTSASKVWVRLVQNNEMLYRGLYNIIVYTTGGIYAPSWHEYNIFLFWSNNSTDTWQHRITDIEHYGAYKPSRIAIESYDFTHFTLYIELDLVYDKSNGYRHTPTVILGDVRYNKTRFFTASIEDPPSTAKIYTL